MNGEVIGMSTAIFSTDGVDAGVGFAVPSNMVKWVADQLQQNGEVMRGWLGIGVQKIRSSDAEQKNKLVVASMTEDSPAAAAGMLVGDVLEDAGGLSLQSPRHFSRDVAQTAPDTVLPLIVRRDDKLIDLEVKVAPMPLDYATKSKKAEEPVAQHEALESTPAEDFPELGIKAVYDEINQEFLVVAVAANSDAEAKGINIGDKFKTVNGHKIFGVEDLRIKIKESAPSGKISLQFIGEDMLDMITLNLKAQDEQN